MYELLSNLLDAEIMMKKQHHMNCEVMVATDLPYIRSRSDL